MREHEPKKPGGPNGHSRRDFLRGSGAAAATAVLTGHAALPLDEAQAAQAASPRSSRGRSRSRSRSTARIARAR